MKSVLIVEDEKIVMDDLLSILPWKQEGYQIVATAVNGRQGFKRFEEFRPQIILTDIRMPVMDGLEMLRRIAALDPNIHFLILSAYDEFSYAQEALALGVSDYILKSEISGKLLMEKLSKISKQIDDAEKQMLHGIKQAIYEHFNGENENSELTRIVELSSMLNYDSWIENIIPYAIKLLSDKFAALQIEDRFEAPSDYSFPAILIWLQTQESLLQNLKEGVEEQPYSPVIVNAIAYINKNFGNPGIKTEDIAYYIGLSKSRLNFLFKQETGLTVNDYITRVRIETAKKLLLSGRYKVYEVAELVGYRSSQYFSQVFYQVTGQNPNKYRREVSH